MKINRTKNTTRNIKWGFIEKLITLLMPFVTRTVLIKILGAEYLGLSSLFTSVLSVLSLAELGFGSAIVFSMYEPIAKDDNDTLCALLNAYRKIYYVIGAVVLAAGLILLPFIGFLIKGDVPSDINVYILYCIYLGNTVVSYFLYAYKTALFSAFQRNDLASKRTAAVTFLSNVFKVVLLLSFRNYYIYVVVIPLATILTNILNARLANRMFPAIQCRGSISKDTAAGIKKRLVGLISFKMYNVIFTSVDTIVISAFLGLTPLAIYNNYYYIQSAITGFITILSASMTAGIGNKMVTNTVADNYRDFKKFVFMNGWVVSWCSVCLICLYQHFILLWVGQELLFPVHTMLLMVAYFTLPKITTMTYTYREAAGLWWEDRFRPIVATVVNLGLNLLLVQICGMDGVIISTLICTVFINVPWGSRVLFKNYFKTSTREYFLRIFYYLIVTAGSAALTWSACSFVPSEGFGGLVIKMVLCVIVPNVLFWVGYFKLPEFGESMKMVKRICNTFCK